MQQILKNKTAQVAVFLLQIFANIKNIGYNVFVKLRVL